MDTGSRESADKAVAKRWFRERDLDLRDYPVLNPSASNPDFEVFWGGQLIGFCELKSIMPGPERELSVGTERQKVRISNAISKAAKQLVAANPDGDLFRFLFIVNHDETAVQADLLGVLEGREEIGGVTLYHQSQNPNGRVGHSLSEIDVVVGVYEKTYVRWTQSRGAQKTALKAIFARGL